MIIVVKASFIFREGKDEKNQTMLFNALEGCDNLNSQEIGKEIKLKDVYMEQYVKEKDG